MELHGRFGKAMVHLACAGLHTAKVPLPIAFDRWAW